jgi:hypothetical protein
MRRGILGDKNHDIGLTGVEEQPESRHDEVFTIDDIGLFT